MFDLPIPQPSEAEDERPKIPAVETFRPGTPERFRAEEALEYEGEGIKALLLKRMDWAAFLGAAVGTAIGYFAHLGNAAFTASLLSTAVFLYASRR